MSIDEQYGQRLGALLHQELDDVRAAPDLVRTLRRRQARRARMLGAAVGAPVAVLAAVAVFITATDPGAPRRPAGPAASERNDPAPVGGDSAPARTPVPAQNVAYIQERTLTALRGAAQYVIYSRTTYSTGYYDVWLDKATQRYRNDVYTQLPPAPTATRRSDGTIRAPQPPPTPHPGPMRLTQSHSTSGPDGNQDTVTVYYDSRTWSARHVTEKNPVPSVPDITDADSVRRMIQNGTVELLGPEVISGRDALHLRFHARQRGYRVDMWVDAATYLPIRSTDSPVEGDTGAGQPASTLVVTSYSWLPRTPENLAKLTLAPPPGFQRR